ncbi:MAG: hypothetical protein AAFQ41_05055 [Cyanobacteria bacterium J06623_7]
MMTDKRLLVLVALLVAIASHFGLGQIISLQSPDSGLVPAARARLATEWQSVTVGGGGYITGVYPHPKEPDLVYVRTDNGGFYRWSGQQWQPITELLPRGDWDYDHNSGGEALGLDPQNQEVVYVAVGKYSDQPGTIFKSTDRGQTWLTSDLATPMGGDEDKRWAGQRLAVSPANSKLVLFGSRREGLWRSLDGGFSWQQEKGLPDKLQQGIGVLNVAFDPQKNHIVYASVYGDGVYQSRDDGVTWSPLVGSPPKVMQLQVAQDGTVYTTNHRSPQVAKYSAGTWQDISPGGIIHKNFNALGVHPEEAQTLIVSEGEKGRGQIFYSQNRGQNWRKLRSRVKFKMPWLAPEFFNDHPAALAFDAQTPPQVWLTDWFSVWRTSTPLDSPVLWSSQIAGIEQTVVFSLAAPPEGAKLISGIADQDGFYHRDLTQSPQARLGFQRRGFKLSQLNLTGNRYLDNFFQDTFHLAFCQNAPQNLVRVGGQRWRETYLGATSSDGGRSWQPWQQIPADKLFMRVAIAPDESAHYVVTVSEDLPLVTFNNGQTWTEVTGLPAGEPGPWNWNQPLAADGQDSDHYYYYSEGRVYGSRDGGRTFQMLATKLPQAQRYVLTTVPGSSGEIWLSLDRGGLYHSQDGGNSFERIKSIAAAHLVTVGKTMTPRDSAPVYVYGSLADGRSGLFVSQDYSAPWQQISTLTQTPRSIKVLVASQQEPGLIFAGTDGRGIYYRQFEASVMSSSPPVPIISDT